MLLVLLREIARGAQFHMLSTYICSIAAQALRESFECPLKILIMQKSMQHVRSESHDFRLEISNCIRARCNCASPRFLRGDINDALRGRAVFPPFEDVTRAFNIMNNAPHDCGDIYGLWK